MELDDLKSNIALYFNDAKKEKLLTSEEEIEITRKVKEGDAEARSRLIKSNLRFVVTIAKQYQNVCGLLLDDLISEGNIGLITAVDRFEIDKGFHFVSYAVYWIRQSILKAINEKSRLIRLPLNKAMDIMDIERIVHRLYYQKGEQPHISEIASELGKTPKEVAYIMNLNTEHISIENTKSGYSKEENISLYDVLKDTKSQTIEDSLVTEQLKEELSKAIDTLTETEKYIINARYGLDQEKKTLKEIGEKFNLTKERIRQIEKKALRKMRSNKNLSLKDFI